MYCIYLGIMNAKAQKSLQAFLYFWGDVNVICSKRSKLSRCIRVPSSVPQLRLQQHPHINFNQIQIKDYKKICETGFCRHKSPWSLPGGVELMSYDKIF